MTQSRTLARSFLIVGLFWLTSLSVGRAAGFAVLEQSVSGLGTAYAGVTAGGEDISTLFYNPAGLTEYSGSELLTGSHLIFADTQFNVKQARNSFNQDLSGSSGNDIGESAMLPNIYAATDLSSGFRIGVGLTTPFALGTKYDRRWKGRYEAIDSVVKSLDINPVAALAVNDKISVGFGFSAQYIDVELSHAIDFGTLCFSQFSASACSAAGLLPQTADGEVELRADGWNWGYNAGVLYTPLPQLRLGAAYRSEIQHSVSGTAIFQVPAAAIPLTASGAFNDTTIHADAYVPASASFGASLQAGDRWTWLFDVTWTEWERLQEVPINFTNAAQPDTTLHLNFKNTIRTSIGLIRQVNDNWSIRSGFTYDQSPVRDTHNRSLRIPDNDRYWVAAGISYLPTSELTFNLSYAHVFIEDAPIDRVDALGHSLIGTVQSQVDLVSAQMTMRF